MALEEREKALDLAVSQIEKAFGKGSVMRLGDDAAAGCESLREDLRKSERT